jgi:hypothetical protein
MIFGASVYIVAFSFWPLAKLSWLDYICDLGISGVQA